MPIFQFFSLFSSSSRPARIECFGPIKIHFIYIFTGAGACGLLSNDNEQNSFPGNNNNNIIVDSSSRRYDEPNNLRRREAKNGKVLRPSLLLILLRHLLVIIIIIIIIIIAFDLIISVFPSAARLSINVPLLFLFLFLF